MEQRTRDRVSLSNVVSAPSERATRGTARQLMTQVNAGGRTRQSATVDTVSSPPACAAIDEAGAYMRSCS